MEPNHFSVLLLVFSTQKEISYEDYSKMAGQQPQPVHTKSSSSSSKKSKKEFRRRKPKKNKAEHQEQQVNCYILIIHDVS